MRRLGHVGIAKLLLVLCIGLAVPPSAGANPGASPPTLGYASFVCWNYSRLPRLTAWKETERVIATTLAESYPGLQQLSHEENGSPGELEDFLHKLPDGADQITVVYLAAHQSPGGQWYFPDGTVVDWGTLMADLPKLRRTGRIVLLDCCYAQAAHQWPEWPDKIAPACVFASAADQVTPDLFVFWRRPVDCAVLFPGASRWLHQHHINNSDERISFFGLVWLEAWTKEPSPPRTMADWSNFAQAMTQIAQRASTQIRARFVSHISASFPP